MKWLLLAKLRLSRIGLPPLQLTDQFIVGSQESKRTLSKLYGIAQDRIETLLSEIDLELFTLPSDERAPAEAERAGPCGFAGLVELFPVSGWIFFLGVLRLRFARASTFG